MYYWLNRLPPGRTGPGGPGEADDRPASPPPGVRAAAGGWLVPRGEALVAADDRGLLLGDGLFETMRVVDGRVPFLPAHLHRLAQGCRALGMPPPPPTLSAAVTALTAALWPAAGGGGEAGGGTPEAPGAPPPAHPGGHGFLRLTMTRGVGPRGYAPPDRARPLIIIHGGPWQPPREPLSVWLAPQPIWPHPVLSRVKHTSALERVLRRAEAARRGAQEVLLFNNGGHLVTAGAANLFWVHRGSLYTPDLQQGPLPGVARRFVLQAARGMPDVATVVEGAFPADRLLTAEEVFVTNALQGPRPVKEIFGLAAALADGPAADRQPDQRKYVAPGPVTAALQRAWRQRLETP